MNIGIDIDGVLTDIARFAADYGIKFCYENNLDYKIWIVGIISIITTSVTIYLIGLNESEKELIKEFTNKIYKRK